MPREVQKSSTRRPGFPEPARGPSAADGGNTDDWVISRGGAGNEGATAYQDPPPVPDGMGLRERRERGLSHPMYFRFALAYWPAAAALLVFGFTVWLLVAGDGDYPG